MLSRRHLRIKTLQSLYAFFLSDNKDVHLGEKVLLSSLDKLHELYIYQLSLLVELVDFARQRQEDAKQKYFPTDEERNPNTRFIDNRFIASIAACSSYQKYFQQYKINWSLHPELIKKLYLSVREHNVYETFLAAEDTPKSDINLLSWVFTEFLSGNDVLEDVYEDRSIFWGADFELSVYLLHKTLKYYQEQNYTLPTLPSLMKEEPAEKEEDLTFMKYLFRKTIIHDEEYDKMIQSKLENWELDRIAAMDALLLKMALCELIEFPSIPVKVTMNEYIDIAKSFSTPKSNYFINGILDKLLIQLREEKKVNKRGRGLME